MAPAPNIPKWGQSNARQLLIDDILNGIIPLTNAEMMPAVVYRSRPEYAQYAEKDFPRRLKGVREICIARLNQAPAPAPNIPAWGHSNARQLLIDDILNGIIPLTNEEMMPSVAYRSRPEYAQYPESDFPPRLKAVREICKARLNRSVVDTAAYHNDRRFDVRPAQAATGLPRWEGSEAERFLKEDIENELHEQMLPRELFMTRSAYFEVFTLKVFRGHIAQEVKRRKFVTTFYGR